MNAPTITSDLHVRALEPLPSPERVLAELPLTGSASDVVGKARDEIRDVLHGRDDRLVVVVGPCSIHDPAAALDYARRLAALVPSLEDDLVVVMRVYFEKPRTTVGWKGLINDPHLDGSHDITTGLRLAREILLGVLAAGVPAANEFLEPTSPQYIADAVSWGAIGARNPESQVHRQLASGLSMPVGFKNATEGSVQAAVDGCITAASPHVFFGIDPQGRAAAVETSGNPDCHIILRGGAHGPNYDDASVAGANEIGVKGGLPPRLVVDASHGNSGKSEVRQAEVARELAASIAAGNDGIFGIMLESFIEPGNQAPAPSGLVYGKSVTDKCIGWDETERLLGELAVAVRARRANS
ncbi:3-deoxy-7-phosphoheptulonate synthase [Rarobacter faecitabidus]|uniref:Phospho-2-dehydro-3-deoxyheptonate aldolase n=1 Tax=Rarobacter faecitabidus TaxID=13243 RepID=A0A542ZTG5_RARFA|nr:3-deoxy-7-phosphoheptulonate synthase [Rarobacter faecitabidus]TQL63587.1 3-deoxy-D-arabinoheptulosonate-7-phosphate synthase [Rarobacter faecitabidus]